MPAAVFFHPPRPWAKFLISGQTLFMDNQPLKRRVVVFGVSKARPLEAAGMADKKYNVKLMRYGNVSR
jgi:hypothetical protein